MQRHRRAKNTKMLQTNEQRRTSAGDFSALNRLLSTAARLAPQSHNMTCNIRRYTRRHLILWYSASLAANYESAATGKLVMLSEAIAVHVAAYFFSQQ